MSDETKAETSIDAVTGNTGAPPSAGYDASFRDRVRETLAKKASGAMTYQPLDEVAAEFDFDAR